MRACMVAYTYYDFDNRVRRYAELLVSKGWHVDAIVIQQKNSPKYEVLNGVHVYRIQKRTTTEIKKTTYLKKLLIFLFNSMILLCKKSIKNKYDIIHVHSVPDFEVFAAIFQKIFGVKIILDIHDLVPELFTSKFNSNTNNFMFKLLVFVEKISCSFVDHVIIANHLWGERLIKRSVPQRKCSVIMNYPDTNIFKRSDSKKDKNKFLLVYPGTLVKHQGVEAAIRAVALLIEKIPNI
jgi:glycosyltransferase involved in cell wall biosynthesis